MNTIRPNDFARQLRHFCAIMSLSLACAAAPAFAANCNGSTQNKAKISQAGMNTVFQEGGAVTVSANVPGSNPAPPTGIYSWSQVSGPAVTLTPTTGTSTTFTVPHVTTGHAAVLVLRLTVTGATCTGAVPSTETISINLANLNNFPPVAVASASATSVSAGTQVFLYSAGSYDPDNDPIVFSWTQTQGPAVTILGANTATASFVAPPVASTTTFRFQLTATENLSSGLFGLATVDVNVVVANSPPTAQLSCPTSVDEGQTITLDGSASTDPENGALAYAFSQLSGFPLAAIPAGPHGSSVSFPAPALGLGQPGLVQFGLTVTDNGNASSSANCSFFIKDVTAPVLSGNVDLMKEATSPSGAVATYSVSAFDNVDGASDAICVPVSGSTFALGQTTVNCSKTDSSGNTGNASFKVTVVDTTAPIIDSHGDVTEEATSAAGAIVSYTSPSTSDVYDGAGTATCSPASGTQFAITTTPVTCNATDSQGNAATATNFNVIVADTTAPSITPPADATVEATGPLTVVAHGTATGTDAVGPVDITSDAPASFAVGVTTIHWLATDFYSNSSSATSTVTVTDLTAPVVDDNGDQLLEATSAAGAVATFASPSALDLVDGALSSTCDHGSGAIYPIGTTTVTCSATDAAGNTGSSSFDITVQDTTPPVIAAHGDETEEATGPSGAVVSYSNPTASDIVDGSVAVNCTPASGGVFALGVTTVNCSATDAAGNTGASSFTVTVQDTTPPVIAAHGDETEEATGPSGAAVSYSNPTASDIVDVSVAVTCTPASGSTFALGTATVDCSATDAAGNIGSSSFDITVRDTTPPVIAAHANLTAEATGPSGAAISYSNPTASDIVDVSVAVTCTPVSGSMFALGTATVNCSATDTAGNIGTSSFTVTVRDTTAPAIAFHADVNAIATSASGAVVTYTLPTASDLVDGAVAATCSPVSGSTFAVGTTTVTCSATDSRGNPSTSTFNVIVSYNFSGFFRPVDNLPIVNVVKAGQGIPVKFSLGGNMGLAIMAAGYPKSVAMTCAGGLQDAVEETVTAGGSTLAYDATAGQYIYVWKSDKAWAGTCRQLQVKLADGSLRIANFNFTR